MQKHSFHKSINSNSSIGIHLKFTCLLSGSENFWFSVTTSHDPHKRSHNPVCRLKNTLWPPFELYRTEVLIMKRDITLLVQLEPGKSCCVIEQ